MAPFLQGNGEFHLVLADRMCKAEYQQHTHGTIKSHLAIMPQIGNVSTENYWGRSTEQCSTEKFSDAGSEDASKTRTDCVQPSRYNLHNQHPHHKDSPH